MHGKTSNHALSSISALLLIVCLLVSLTLPAFAEEPAKASGLPEIRIQLADGLSLSTVNSGSKDTKYPGNTVTLVSPDGKSSEYTDVELKGRGNFTWSSAAEKKPYQIKFDSKTKVFGMDKAKKWVLLANHGDCTLMRNQLAFDLAKAMGMPYTPESVWADVYVNDEYIGNYLVCEKNEVGSSRVPLEDDYGVLCEIDGNYGTSEDVYAETSYEKTIVVLSDSVADDVGEDNSVSEAAFKVFCDKLSRFEALLYDENATWEQIEELIDVESFVKYYFIQELTEDSDGCRSSFYLWSDGKDDLIHLGPVWDYDISMGGFEVETRGGNTKVDYTVNIEKYMGSSSVGWFKQLFGFCAFNKLAVDIYNSEIKPVFNSIPAMIDGYLTDGDAPSAFAVSAGMNFERWNNILGHSSIYGSGAHKYASTFEKEVSYLKNWLSQRVSYLNSRYASFPCLSGCKHGVTVEAETDSNGASTLKTAATCTADEVYYKVCNACGTVINGDTWTKTDTALGHDYTGEIRCNHDGTHSFKCVNNCGSYGGTESCVYPSGSEICDICNDAAFSVKLNVKVNVLKTLLFKLPISSTYTLNVSSVGGSVSKVQYSIDGGHVWLTGKTVTLLGSGSKFAVRVYGSNGSITYFNVNGTSVTLK